MSKIDISKVKLAAYATVTALGIIYFMYQWIRFGFKSCSDELLPLLLFFNLTVDNALLLNMRKHLIEVSLQQHRKKTTKKPIQQ